MAKIIGNDEVDLFYGSFIPILFQLSAECLDNPKVLIYNCTNSTSTIFGRFMEIQIDPNNAIPIYLQIIYSIKHQVATGRLKPGEQLPTVRMLATELRINPNTVARAYASLDTEGVITTQRGRGTYVREHPDDAHLRRVRKDQLKAMMDNVVNNALSLGYPAEEIRLAFEIELARWERQRRSTTSSHDTRSDGPDANLVLKKPKGRF